MFGDSGAVPAYAFFIAVVVGIGFELHLSARFGLVDQAVGTRDLVHGVVVLGFCEGADAVRVVPGEGGVGGDLVGVVDAAVHDA